METREWNHVDSELTEIRVKLTWESQTSGDTRHDGRDEVVEISIGWVGELQSTDADVVQSLYILVSREFMGNQKGRTNLVINTESLIRVLDKLMNGESSIIWLDNGIGNLWTGNNGERSHHSVGEFFTDLRDEKSTHASTSSTTKRVSNLETLEAVTAFSFTTNDIKDLVNKLSTLGIMTLGPVVSSTGLTKDKVVWSEKLTEWTSSDCIHGSGLQINKHGTRNELVSRGLMYSKISFQSSDISKSFRSYLIEVDAHTLELQVRGTLVSIQQS
jgi:hypothetical protein